MHSSSVVQGLPLPPSKPAMPELPPVLAALPDAPVVLPWELPAPLVPEPVEPVPGVPELELAPALEVPAAAELRPEPALVAEPDSPPPLVAAPEVPPTEVEPIVPEEPPPAVALPAEVAAPLAVDCRQQPAISPNGAQTSTRATASQRCRLLRASVGRTLRGDGDLFVVRRDPGFAHGLLLSRWGVKGLRPGSCRGHSRMNMTRPMLCSRRWSGTSDSSSRRSTTS